MTERILVGIDGSGPSRAAFSWALTRARATGASVLAIHSVEDGADDRGPELLDEALSTSREHAAGVVIASQLVHGSAPFELAALAEPGDLLVVGTHKTGYLNGRVLGTRSIIISSVAHCSVVVVPDAAPSGRTGILVGVATDGASNAAVIAGAQEAARLRADLTLLHCTDPTTDGNPEATESGRAALADAVALAATVAPGLVVRSRLARRRPAEALLDASRSSALLIVGASRRGIEHLGSVACEVLLNINTTVMVARQ